MQNSQYQQSGTDLVTGGAGFIGSHLVDQLLEAGRNVVVLDNFYSGGPHNLAQHDANPALTVMEGDIRDANAVSTAMAGAERVFHLAALADIVPSIQQPDAYYSTNVTGTFNVVQSARQAGISRLVYAASSSCYGIPDIYPTPETSPIQPQYPYALTKFLGEELVLHWGQVYGLSTVSLRFFNVYGPRSRTSGAYGAVFGVFLAQLLANKPLTVVGNGTQTRDFTFVGDVANALIAAADAAAPASPVYNVGTGADVSVNRLVELLEAHQVNYVPKRPGEPDCTLADVSRIRAELGWSAATPIETGVQIMLDNIDYWRDAPVWTPGAISEATRDWFRYLS